jgi:OHCU decarboxylase
MVAAVRAAPRERQVELIAAHPELAGREALSDASASEQAAAGLDRLTADEAQRWRALNQGYRERFGFPLVVCVREHTKESILAWGEERLGHERDDEIEVALAEIAKIGRLRLEELDG